MIISAACFGTLAVLTPLAYDKGAQPLPLLTWRFVIASALLASLATLRSRHSLAVPATDLARFALLAVGGYGAASICFFFALQHADAGVVAVLLYTYPAMVAAAGALLTRRPLGAARLLALGLTFSGCVLVIDPFGASVATDVAGVLLGLGAAAGYASFNLLSHRWLPGRSRLVMMAWTFAFAAVLAAIASKVTGSSLSTSAWAVEVWWLLAAIVAIPTFAAVVLYLEGIRGLGATQAAIVSTLEPLFTISLAWVVLDQQMRPLQLVGAALVLAGVVVAERAGSAPGAGEGEADALAVV